ncbi:MAG: GumC family protein [Pseudomonadota bacterium]
MLPRFTKGRGGKGGDGLDGTGERNRGIDSLGGGAVAQGSLLDSLHDSPKPGASSSLAGAPGARANQADVIAFPPTLERSSKSSGILDTSLLNQFDAADRARQQSEVQQRLQEEHERQETARKAELQRQIARDRAARLAEREAALEAQQRSPAAAQMNQAPPLDPRLAQLDLLSDEIETLKRARGDLPTAQTQASEPARPTMPNDGLTAANYDRRDTVRRLGDGATARPGRSTDPQMVGAEGVASVAELLSFGRFVRALLSGWWLILLCALAGGALAAVYAMTLPNQFQSIAEVLIEPRGLKVLDNTVAPTGLNSEATVAFAESQVRIITSSSVLDPVIKELELNEDPEFNGTQRTGGALMRFFELLAGSEPDATRKMAITRESLNKAIFVNRISQTFTIQIGATSEDPAKAARIANTIARSYLQEESGAKSSAARSANQDLSGRLDELRLKVREAEERVERYKAENGLVDADGKLVSDVQLVRLNDQLALAQIQTTDARTKAEQARQAGLNDVLSGSLPSSLSSNAVNQLRLAYSRAKTRRDRVATRLGARHPERIAAESELTSARNAITGEIRRIIRGAQSDFSRAKKRQDELVASVNQLKGRAVTEAAAKVQLRELEREVQANRSVYEAFLLRSRETDEQSNIRAGSARVITEAVPPRKKSGPARRLLVVAGTIVGGGLGSALALIPFFFVGLHAVLAGGGGAPSPMNGPEPGTRHPSGNGIGRGGGYARNDGTEDGDLYSTSDTAPVATASRQTADEPRHAPTGAHVRNPVETPSQDLDPANPVQQQLILEGLDQSNAHGHQTVAAAPPFNAAPVAAPPTQPMQAPVGFGAPGMQQPAPPAAPVLPPAYATPAPAVGYGHQPAVHYPAAPHQPVVPHMVPGQGVQMQPAPLYYDPRTGQPVYPQSYPYPAPPRG